MLTDVTNEKLQNCYSERGVCMHFITLLITYSNMLCERPISEYYFGGGVAWAHEYPISALGGHGDPRIRIVCFCLEKRHFYEQNWKQLRGKERVDAVGWFGFVPVEASLLPFGTSPVRSGADRKQCLAKALWQWRFNPIWTTWKRRHKSPSLLF